MKPKLKILKINLVLISIIILNNHHVNCFFSNSFFNRFSNWSSISSRSIGLSNLQNNLHNSLNSLQRRALDLSSSFSNRTLINGSARSYASMARRLSQVGNQAIGIQEFSKLLQQLSQLDVNKLPLNAKLAKALQTLTKSKLLNSLTALNEVQDRFGSNNQALAFGALSGNKTLLAAAALRTLLGTALAHARQSNSNDNENNDKSTNLGSLVTNLLSGTTRPSGLGDPGPSYVVEENSVSNNVINTNSDLNTVKQWLLKLSQLALLDRQSLVDDPKQLNAALWSLINLARYFLCK